MLPVADGNSLISTSICRLVDGNGLLFERLMLRCHEETLGFMTKRLHHNTEALEHFRECKGLTGPFSVENSWMINTMSDYLEQTAKTWELWMEFAGNGTKTLMESQMPTFQTQPSHAIDIDAERHQRRRAA